MPNVSGKPSAGPGKITVQTVIFSKSKFKTKAEAKAWAKKHKFKATLEETDGSYRARQYNPEYFQKGSFRTIKIAPGVSVVVGRPKSITNKAAESTVNQLVQKSAEMLLSSVSYTLNELKK